jgi:hypothetical protein
MDEEFRERANEDIARLLAYWQTIEFWIKRAEQVNDDAIIPAINELRYASRQLFNAQRVLNKTELSDGDKSVITKRIIIAEQYLFNADHDIGDAISGFYKILITNLDTELGITAIAIHFPEYPLLRQRVFESLELIAEARHDYDKRAENYKKLRDNNFPQMLTSYRRLLDAEVGAKEERARRDYELVVARARIRIFEVLTGIGAVASIIAVPLAFYFWLYAKADFCAVHPQSLFHIVCDREQPATQTPSIIPQKK